MKLANSRQSGSKRGSAKSAAVSPKNKIVIMSASKRTDSIMNAMNNENAEPILDNYMQNLKVKLGITSVPKAESVVIEEPVEYPGKFSN